MRLGTSARTAVATAAMLAALLPVSACGGNGQTPTSAAPKDPSPSASPTATVDPPSVPAASRNTSAGRIAFATYFVKASNYAYATNDPTPVTSVASASDSYGCPMCTRLKKYLAGQKARGLHLVPADLPVLHAYETAHIRDNVWVVDILSRARKRADVDASGHAVKTYPAKKNYLIEVGVAWENGHYRLTGWKSGENR